MKMVKRCLMPIVLAVVLLVTSFMPFSVNKSKVTANADGFNSNRVYYFSDTFYTALTEAMIDYAFAEYSMRIFDSDVLHELIAEEDMDELFGSQDYKYCIGDTSFSNEAPCKVIFEFMVNKPDTTAVESLISELRSHGYKVMVISGFTDQECDYNTVDEYMEVDIMGFLVSEFLSDFITTNSSNPQFILDRRFFESETVSTDLTNNSRFFNRMSQQMATNLPSDIYLHQSGNEFINLNGNINSLIQYPYVEGSTVYAFGFAPLDEGLHEVLEELHPATNGNTTNLTLEIYLLQIDEIVYSDEGLPADIFGRDCWITEDLEEEILAKLMNM